MSDSQHVGPIIFADETARTQLLEHGDVVTFRTSQRTTGDTWWRTSRTGPKEGDCHVAELGPANPAGPCDRMEEYAHLSGFDSLEAWVGAIDALNGSVSEGYLYRVTVERGESE